MITQGESRLAIDIIRGICYDAYIPHRDLHANRAIGKHVDIWVDMQAPAKQPYSAFGLAL